MEDFRVTDGQAGEMAKSNVKDINLGYQEIQEQLQILSKSYVIIGFPDGTLTKTQTKGDRVKKGGESMAQIASDNEFGTKSIPVRSFMGSSFDENRTKINQLMLREYGKILDGKTTTVKALGLVGQFVKGLAQQKIRAIQFPPNSARTIAIKKSSKPLIDFGQMINALTQKVITEKS